MSEQSPLMRLCCPLAACTWIWDSPPPFADVTIPPEREAVFLAESLALPGESSVHLLAHYLAADAVVEQHLKTHSLMEWVTEVIQLREVIDLTAISLGEGGQIGEFIRAGSVPGSPVAESLAMLREKVAAVPVAGRD